MPTGTGSVAVTHPKELAMNHRLGVATGIVLATVLYVVAVGGTRPPLSVVPQRVATTTSADPVDLDEGSAALEALSALAAWPAASGR
jgi:hypothetical protein